MDSPVLLIRKISLWYSNTNVVDDFSLSLQSRELGCLLGPSGCGKSTLLRAIAGFQSIMQGEIWLDDHLLSTAKQMVLPEERKIGMVFQDVALFPHLTVASNISFGLHDWDLDQCKQRVNELLDLIGLSGLNHRYPYELSGGQQQRVALARAMAPKPKLLLLDEPFSGLDTELRGRLASEVRTILKGDGISSLLVTHDQQEAFDFADRIAVMNDGRNCQFDTPFNLYHEPASPFVAHFVGPGQMIDAVIVGIRSVSSPLGILHHDVDLNYIIGSAVKVFLRPDDLIHDDDSDYTGIVVSKNFRGAHHLYQVCLDNGAVLGCLAPSHHDHFVGERIGVSLDIEHLVVFSV